MSVRFGPERLATVLKWALAGAAIVFLVMYFLLAWRRVTYPYELEWMEGGSVDHVLRLLSGKPIYVAPSLDFVPYIYPPLYYYVSVAFARLFGPGFLALRLVSILASLGCFLAIFEFVRRETRSWYFGLLAAGLFAATYRIGGAWLDIGRVDSLFLLLLLLSAYLLRFYDTYLGLVLSAIFVVLAVLTKQTALPIALGMSVYCLIFLPKWKKIVFPGVFALGLVLSTLVLNAASDGWYFYYVFQLPQAHQIVKHIIVTFWSTDMGYLAVAFAISLIYVLYLAYSGQKLRFGFYLFFLGSTLGAAWLSKLQMTSYDNVRLPPYVAVSICFGLGIAMLTASVATEAAKQEGANRYSARLLFEPFIFLACILQFVILLYNPLEQIPSRQDVAAGDSFVQTLRSIPGEVFVPLHGYVPSLAGKRTYAQDIAVADVLRGDDLQAAGQLRQELVDALRNSKFQAVILDQGPWTWHLEDLVIQEYGTPGRLFSEPDVFWPVTGMRTRPANIYEASK